MRNVTATCSLVLFAFVIVGGCAAEGATLSAEEIAEPTEPAEPAAKLPPPSSPPAKDGGAASAGSKDGGTKADAGKPAPAPGEACAKVDEVFERACGACGTQTALCFADDGGAPRVSDYGPCTDEVANGCVAGAVEDVACGNCGTQKRTCSSSCQWFTAACVQPPGACKAGSVEYTITGCPTKNTYRMRSCSTGCAWSGYTACLEPANDVVVEVNPTVSQTSTTQVTLSASKMDSGVPTGGSCPAASLLTGQYPYAYVEIRNTTTKQAKVYVTSATPAGGSYIYVVLAGYKVPFVPSGEDARKACSYGPSSSLSNIVIDPGTSMLVYVRSNYVYNPSSPSQTTGVMNLNVRTDSLL